MAFVLPIKEEQNTQEHNCFFSIMLTVQEQFGTEITHHKIEILYNFDTNKMNAFYKCPHCDPCTIRLPWSKLNCSNAKVRVIL